MEKSNPNTIPGTITVSKKAAMQAAEYIAMNTPGVVRMSEKTKRGDITKILLGTGGTKGVHFTQTPEGFIIEIYVICRYGSNAAQICRNISKSIRAELSGNMGIPIKRVTVRVDGVDGAIR